MLLFDNPHHEDFENTNPENGPYLTVELKSWSNFFEIKIRFFCTALILSIPILFEIHINTLNKVFFLPCSIIEALNLLKMFPWI